MQSIQLTALEKSIEKPEEGAQWNNSLLKWIVLYQQGQTPKTF